MRGALKHHETLWQIVLQRKTDCDILKRLETKTFLFGLRNGLTHLETSQDQNVSLWLKKRLDVVKRPQTVSLLVKKSCDVWKHLQK